MLVVYLEMQYYNHQNSKLSALGEKLQNPGQQSNDFGYLFQGILRNTVTCPHSIGSYLGVTEATFQGRPGKKLGRPFLYKKNVIRTFLILKCFLSGIILL